MNDDFDEDIFLGEQQGTYQAEEQIVRKEPRISASKLAEYVIADPSRQKTILRDAKFVKKVLILPYKQARAGVRDAFSAGCLDINVLCQHAKDADGKNQIKDISDWQRTDNANSAAALRNMAAVAPELQWKEAQLMHIKMPSLEIAGVKVSIHPELVFRFQHRNITKIGAVILNTGKAEAKSLERRSGAHCVGDYLSSLVFQVLLMKATQFGAPLNKKCYAVDVFRKKVYSAPANYRKLNKNLEAACEMIASRWKDINSAL